MRYTNVFEINNYREACKFLQDKYDALGFKRLNYFNKKADGTLSKNSKVGHGNEGLQYHHICEDIVPSLSSKERAEANLYEYQTADNMCYANLLEHAWLHILITENNSQASDNSQDDITGIGGVQWMLLALNSIMCNADTSWYSSKNEDGKGCSYNVGNIITDNRDAWLKVVNRFCTSAFIRQRLGKTPQELATLICLSCKNDGTQGGLLSIYNDILAEANSTKLFNWNVNAFADLVNFLRDNQSALVYICTGGGKTTTALEYLRLFGGKALVLGPGETIKSGWEDEKNWKDLGTTADVVNYQTFMNDYKTRDLSKYSVVICDEAHHLGAERWGEGIRWILENKPEIKIIGLTATPTKEQFEGTDTEFGGRVCYGLDLATGIKEDNIWPFSYISSIYKMEDVKDEFEKYGTEGRILWDRLNIKLNETPVVKILQDRMPEGQRKIIVFCSSIKDIPYAEEVMNKYDPTLECRVITSKQDSKQNNTAKEWFNDTADKNVCLITVSMVNEGAHYDGVNTLIMFRRTHSATLYLQQLGRVVVTKKKPNPNGIVFDFTNNAENLIYNSTVQVEVTSDDISETEVTEDEKKEIIGIVKKAIQECSGKEVIYEDYTEDCVATLNTLREAQNVNKQSAVIYSAFDDLKKALEAEEQDFFYYDLWANLETTAGNLSITRPKHATSKKTSDTFDEALAGKRSITKKVVKASEVEKLATAFRTAIRRLYNFGYIEFADMRSFDITILNKSKFNETIKTLGFKNAKLFEDVMNKLNKHSLIIASNI
jgi:superfamily II DNA or RNA helicase